MPVQKQEVITFKVDAELAEVIRRLPNRSEFIRRAVLDALESTCPLCQGSGILSTSQKRHWDEFAKDHEIRECDDCHEFYVVCRGET